MIRKSGVNRLEHFTSSELEAIYEFEERDTLLGGFKGCDARALKLIIERVAEIERLSGEEAALSALRKAALELMRAPTHGLDS